VKELLDKEYKPIILDIDLKNIEEMKEKYSVLDVWNLDTTNVIRLQEFRDKLSDEFCLDHIICLAGRALEDEWKEFEKQDIIHIQKSIELNLIGHINIIHTFLPILKKSKAKSKSITLISSINAFGDFGLPAYSSSKSGIYGLVKSLCSELGKERIRINAISPGTIVTPATELEPKNFDNLLKGTAIGEFATKEEIAKTVRFIIETNGITGQNIIVDAGQSTVLKKK
jgi:NAD(P)-dependent dehydrogenase (short-subunit alcohol dehydrogenase family)